MTPSSMASRMPIISFRWPHRPASRLVRQRMNNRSVLTQQIGEHAVPKVERVKRHTLVDAVEHPGEIKICGQAQRRKPVPDDVEPGERLVVSAPRKEIGKHR